MSRTEKALLILFTITLVFLSLIYKGIWLKALIKFIKVE